MAYDHISQSVLMRIHFAIMRAAICLPARDILRYAAAGIFTPLPRRDLAPLIDAIKIDATRCAMLGLTIAEEECRIAADWL